MSASACGKVILLGEHAVVYGVPALAVGIDRGAEATAREGSTMSTLRVGDSDAVRADDPESELARAFRAILGASGWERPVDVDVQTDLPAGAGLGCSAALGVAIARAIAQHADKPINLAETIDRATTWERVFHGNPSGVDATVAARGGVIRFLRGQPAEDVRLRTPIHLAIGHTGLSSSTKVMVDGLAHLRERRPEQVEKSFEAIRSLVGNAKLALEAGDHVGLGKLLDLNQMVLSGLMLSSAEIERMCDLARTAGALGAKLTGAGGGGCVIALCAGSCQPILDAWFSAGFQGFSTIVGATAAPSPHVAGAVP